MEALGRGLMEPQDRHVTYFIKLTRNAEAPFEMGHQALSSLDVHGFDADRDTTAVLVLASEIKAAVILIPKRERQRRQRLQIRLTEVLAAVTICVDVQVM